MWRCSGSHSSTVQDRGIRFQVTRALESDRHESGKHDAGDNRHRVASTSLHTMLRNKLQNGAAKDGHVTISPQDWDEMDRACDGWTGTTLYVEGYQCTPVADIPMTVVAKNDTTVTWLNSLVGIMVPPRHPCPTCLHPPLHPPPRWISANRPRKPVDKSGLTCTSK